MTPKATDASERSRPAESQSPRGEAVPSRTFGRFRGLALLCFSVATALVLLRTEVLPLGAVRAELYKDYGLLTWNFWAVTESALRGENPYETRLLFHPLGSNLAAHTLAPGFLPIGLAAKLARGGAPDYPLFARRLSLLACAALGVFLAHHALRALGADPLAATATAVGWSFAACWQPSLLNPTLASACFLIPGVTLAAVRLLESPSGKRAVALVVLVSGSVYFSEYYSAFIALALLAVAVSALAFRDTRGEILSCGSAVGARGLALAAAVGLLVALPFLVNWTGSQGRPPPARQLKAGSANLAGFVLPSPTITPLYAGETTSRLYAQVSRGRGVFVGIPTALLATVALVTAPPRRRRLLLLLAIVYLVLSLGPVLKVLGTNTGVSLPYELLRHVPPFQMARAPHRLAAIGMWGLVCLAALGLTATASWLARRVHPVAGIAASVLALGWWIGEGYRPVGEPFLFTPPPELSRLPQGAVANLPLSNTDGLAMFLQVFHERPILTGYVSRPSERQGDHVRSLQELLDTSPRAFGRQLRALGVKSLIFGPGTPPAAASRLANSGFVTIDLRRGLPLRDAQPCLLRPGRASRKGSPREER